MKRTRKMSKVIFGCLLGLSLVFVSAHQALAQGTWETSNGAGATLTPMPTSRNTFAVGAINGKLYAVGGSAIGEISTPTLEVYDPATNTWDSSNPAKGAGTLVPMPTSRAFPSGAVANDKLYVVSGCINADCGGGNTPVLEVYDPSNQHLGYH